VSERKKERDLITLPSLSLKASNLSISGSDSHSSFESGGR
jgi:hypothetical protein